MLTRSELAESLCAQERFQGKRYDWFPGLLDIDQEQAARRVCDKCPVKFECAQSALRQRESWGIWGGMEEFRMRRALGVDSLGNNRVYTRALRCPFCNSDDLTIAKKKGPHGYPIRCNYCDIDWTSYRIPDKIRKTLKRRHDSNLAAGVEHAGDESRP